MRSDVNRPDVHEFGRVWVGKIPYPVKDSPSRRVPRVLIIDDEPLIRWSLATALRTLGCFVTETGDSASAAGVLREAGGRFDTIFLDLTLPDCRDLSTLHLVRALAPRSRLVVVSAHGTRETEASVLAAGAERFVSKPFNIKMLASLATEPSILWTDDDA
jgi:DNA-binding NtrC family response regulator